MVGTSAVTARWRSGSMEHCMPMAVGMSVARESMGTVDVCGDGVPLHVVCLGLPCKV
jgi:thiamine pyrophosphate-dependent acetolactate synthase large subunit-like protein